MQGLLATVGGYGTDVVGVGDVNGDDIGDIIVISATEDIARLLFMNDDGTIASFVEIDEADIDASFDLQDASVAAIGDRNGDLVPDVVFGDPDLGNGAVFVTYLNADGSILSTFDITPVSDLEGDLIEGEFGAALESIADFDGDNYSDIAVGVTGGNGAVWLLMLNADGTLKTSRRLDRDKGLFSNNEISGILIGGETGQLGSVVRYLGDIDADGIGDIAVGLPENDIGFGEADHGVVYILRLNSDTSVKGQTNITAFSVGGVITANDQFGYSMGTSRSDTNRDGIRDLYIGSKNTNELYLTYLNADGTVAQAMEISALIEDAGVDVQLTTIQDIDFVDLDGRRAQEMIIGMPTQDEGGGKGESGATLVVFLDALNPLNDADRFVVPRSEKISINGGATCVESTDITVTVSGTDAIQVVVGSDIGFTDAAWQEYVSKPMSIPFHLTGDDGEKQIFVLYKSVSRNNSIIDSRTVLLDRVNGCQ